MKRIASLPSLTVLFVALFVSISLPAQTSADTIAADAQSFSFASDSTHAEVSKALADSAYSAGEYATAIDLYERLLIDGESAVLYYNLGNAYYKVDDMSRAILNYERALRLNPSDKDVRFNLDLARSKTIDRVNDRVEIFFVRWFRSLTSLLSLDGWARVAIVTFLLFLFAVALFVFGRKRSLRKTSLILALILLFLTVCSNGIGYGQKRRLNNRTEAIVMDPSVVVRSTPSPSGTELFVLHEGRKVTITDDAMQAWKQIALEDGNVGWIETKSLTVI
ncbi:MAG: tetratricopeptide repeat protein [Bacteroidaceae bacterium]|nr:tetratricopeptide repeat protein [Bacteroidaceae bacterium]